MGAPTGNQNARTHGGYSNPPSDDVSLDDRIAGLNQRIERLGELIDELQRRAIADVKTIDIEAYAKLLSLYGQLCSRLGRLMRDQQRLTGDEDTELDAAMDEAIDLAAELLDADL